MRAVGAARPLQQHVEALQSRLSEIMPDIPGQLRSLATACDDQAAEFGCRTWAQFSLKYILSNPRVTSVLTETSNPKHMAENAQAAFGPVPTAAARQRMRDFIDRL